MITLVIVLGVVYTYVELQLPDVTSLKDVRMQVPLRIYTSDGKLIAQYGAKQRIPVKMQDIPPQMVNAVLAVEDARYYSHPGVDFIGIVRAAKAVISSGRKVQGASTITMQVARNFFLTRKKTYWRKVREILLALKIDKELSKDKVLELYLNKVYFGSRAYGVGSAAQVYYGKRLDQLTLAQMAMIAGLPQAPSMNNPLINPKRALDRRNHVLSRMLDVGFIDKAAYIKAIAEPLTATYHGERAQVYAPYVAEMARQVVVSQYGETAYDMGLNVYTTINAKLQTAANQALHDGLVSYTNRHSFKLPQKNLGDPQEANLNSWQIYLKRMSSLYDLRPAAILEDQADSVTALLSDGSTVTIDWAGLSWMRPKPTRPTQLVHPGDIVWVQKTSDGWRLAQLPRVQGALVAMNPKNGSLLALAGGFDYRLSSFNRATQAERQPGSNFKPFIYSAALEKGFTWATMLNDAPIVIQDPGTHQLWRPHNNSKHFNGLTRLRIALMRSINMISIRLLQDIGIDYALQYISRFGFDSSRLPHSLSLALGSGGVTPLQIATGYSIIANGGYRILPHFVSKVVNQNNEVLFQDQPLEACEACLSNPNLPKEQLPLHMAQAVLTPQNAYLMTSGLQSVVQGGTAQAAKVLNRTDLAGKTGTTNNEADAWFSGFNSNIEATVWVGFDDLSSLHEHGAEGALPIWVQFMKTALQNMPSATMPRPPGIVSARIDPRTGLLANAKTRATIFEIFDAKHLPKTYSAPIQLAPANAPNALPPPGAGQGVVAPSQTAPPPPASTANDPLF